MTAHARATDLRILVVHAELPLHDRHAGSLRLFRLLQLLAADGHEVTFVARCGIGQERYTAELTAAGIDVHPLDRERLRERGINVLGGDLDFAELCARGRFDVAILSFYELAEQYLPLLRRHSPLTRVVIDTVDVHHVRERRGAELSGDRAALAAAERTRAREQAIYGAADALVAVSEDDAAALRELTPEVPVGIVSTIHDEAPTGPPFEAREGLVFVGNFGHAPNVDAVLDFHARSWPLVRAALPGVRLTLVGTDPPPAVQQLAGDGIDVTGWVLETAPYLDRARVSIAPLRYGAGVKGKIGEAMSHGLPVVTTTIGAEGLALLDGAHALVANAPEAFAAAIARLHEDAELWRALSSAGRDHIEARLSPAAARESLHALLGTLARTAFVTALDPADPTAALVPALRGYLAAFEPDDRVSLAMTVPAADPSVAQAALAAAGAELERLGRDPEAIPDVTIEPWSDGLPLPSTAVRVTTSTNEAGEERRAIAPDAPPTRWRELAETTARPSTPAATARRRSAPRAAVLVHATDDAPALGAQLDALGRAALPEDVELVIATDELAPAAAEVVARSGARVVRVPETLGRRAAWQLAAQAAHAPFAVALAPLALPSAGFLDPILAGLTRGATLVAPVVAGAYGLHVAEDGSLWPRGRDAAEPLAALPLDCIGATRELVAAGLPEMPSGEGHRETQLARWANDRGGLGLAAEARVERLAAPAASVIVCTRNRAEELPDGIALLCASGAQDVVIVDNGSTDATAEVAAELAARFPGIVRVTGEPRAGLCHARNAGAAAARHELLLFVDDDARVAPGWLEHVAHTLARPGVANVGGPICALWPSQRAAGWPGRELEALLSVLDLGDAERALVPPDVVYGANWSVRRTALEAVGGFDPAFGPSPDGPINGDEVSVAWRLNRAGVGTTRYAPGGAVGHRISVERVDERFLVHRSLCVGVERPRHAHALGEASPQRLVQDAQGAVRRLLGTVALSGELELGAALDAIAAAPLPLRTRVFAADALGELAACVLLAGEHQVIAGELTLSVHDEALQGRPASVPVAG